MTTKQLFNYNAFDGYYGGFLELFDYEYDYQTTALSVALVTSLKRELDYLQAKENLRTNNNPTVWDYSAVVVASERLDSEINYAWNCFFKTQEYETREINLSAQIKLENSLRKLSEKYDIDMYELMRVYDCAVFAGIKNPMKQINLHLTAQKYDAHCTCAKCKSDEKRRQDYYLYGDHRGIRIGKHDPEPNKCACKNCNPIDPTVFSYITD